MIEGTSHLGGGGLIHPTSKTYQWEEPDAAEKETPLVYRRRDTAAPSITKEVRLP